MSLTSYRAAPPRGRAVRVPFRGTPRLCEVRGKRPPKGLASNANAALQEVSAAVCEEGKEGLSLAGPAMTYSPGS